MGTPVFAVANEKGGVAKTTTVVSLGATVAANGGRALIVDMDSQGNASRGVGIDPDSRSHTTIDVVTSPDTVTEAVTASSWTNVDVIPAARSLANLETIADPSIIYGLDDALQKHLDLSQYDAVFIDCPPNLGRRMFTALCAATGVLIVTEPEFFSVLAVFDLEETIAKLKERSNPRLEIAKIIITKRSKNGEHIAREDELRRRYGDLVASTSIPLLAAQKDAQSTLTSIHEFRGGRAIALQTAYIDVWNEIRNRVAA